MLKARADEERSSHLAFEKSDNGAKILVDQATRPDMRAAVEYMQHGDKAPD